MSQFATTPDPPYYAVIFTSERNPGDDGYGETADRMLELARGMPGYLGVESARDAPGCRIFIGSENRMFALSGSSVIAAPYRGSQGEVVGVVGVIGPTRLNYARVVPMVDFTAKALTRLMA